MEGSALPATTAADALDRLIAGGYENVIVAARREYEEWTKASGIGHRRNHIDPDMVTYRRGRWHASVRMLALLAGMDVSIEEPNPLEFVHAFLAYSE